MDTPRLDGLVPNVVLIPSVVNAWLGNRNGMVVMFTARKQKQGEEHCDEIPFHDHPEPENNALFLNELN